ncbi:MAG: Ku protein [Thermoleophilaceae bacterium]
MDNGSGAKVWFYSDSAHERGLQMPRSIWTGAISFGLVNVPVKLYSAVSKKTVRFHQLHDADGVRLQQKRICPADGEEVPYENVVKGYEITPEQYVVVTQEELDALDPAKTKTIDIEDFVDLAEIDPIYYDHAYYLLPDRGAAKAYKLLLTAMADAQKVAIARVVIRTKEQLVAIRPSGELLAMTTMNFADEVIPHDRFDELPGEEVETAKREIDMARQLIESLTAEFEPGRYHDTYRERVLDLVERKAEGKEIAVQPVEEPQEVPDLMAALEASVRAARESRDDDEPKPKPSGARRRGIKEDGAAKKGQQRRGRERAKKE